ncbi:hypothetical protein PMES_02033 [Profundibacterium mesophilum KAUST100406-0324]|uniref:Uncharacterized protein n=1 Tax=Profundibacterium mesophilum KAUST100406-0324 TaxID=1037889 RepID=A0A921NY87_9RHOB|nr:hypothetical protein PMES_02033 [Profundibacterium mesophilum KAUST100406-0324]
MQGAQEGILEAQDMRAAPRRHGLAAMRGARPAPDRDMPLRARQPQGNAPAQQFEDTPPASEQEAAPEDMQRVRPGRLRRALAGRRPPAARSPGQLAPKEAKLSAEFTVPLSALTVLVQVT